MIKTMADKKEKRKESFVMYESFIDAASYLDGNDFKECVLKIRDYALYGSYEPSDKQIINVILAMAKPNLDAAEKRRQRQIENGMKGKEYGILGGRPKSKESNNNPSKPLEGDIEKPLNDKVNDTVNDKEKVDDDGNGDGKDPVVNTPMGYNGPSSIPSPSFSSFSSSSIDSNREQQEAINPSVINIKEKDKNKIKESGGTVAAASNAAYQEMSICDYLKEIINNNVKQMLKYDEEHRDYDEQYKKLHVEAVKALLELKGGEYEQANDFLKYFKKHYYDEEYN